MHKRSVEGGGAEKLRIGNSLKLPFTLSPPLPFLRLSTLAAETTQPWLLWLQPLSSRIHPLKRVYWEEMRFAIINESQPPLIHVQQISEPAYYRDCRGTPFSVMFKNLNPRLIARGINENVFTLADNLRLNRRRKE